MSHHEDRRQRPWFEFNSGLSKRQYESLRREIHQMSDALTTELDALRTEMADIKTTQDKVVELFGTLKENLDTFQAANADLQAQIDTLTADAAVSQSTIDALNAANAAGAASVAEILATAEQVDEALETISGEP